LSRSKQLCTDADLICRRTGYHLGSRSGSEESACGRRALGLEALAAEHGSSLRRLKVRDRPAAAGPTPGLRAAPERFDLHGLQRLGSFLNCLSKKKSCSPAVKMNSPPQSAQVNSLSTKSIQLLPYYTKEIRQGCLICGDAAEAVYLFLIIHYFSD
jgi:hypothetical protein